MTSTNSLTLGAVPDALASRRSEPAKARRHRPQFVLWIVVLVCAVYFIFPIWATAKFTLDIPLQGWTFSAYRQAINEPQLHTTLWLSVRIAAGTVALSFLIMVWTVMWSSLKVKRAQSAVEFTSIVPYMVPPIAFVTGIGGAFRGIFPNFPVKWPSFVRSAL